jgi:hypothetical protein
LIWINSDPAADFIIHYVVIARHMDRAFIIGRLIRVETRLTLRAQAIRRAFELAAHQQQSNYSGIPPKGII